jgi:hypothetical protein
VRAFDSVMAADVADQTEIGSGAPAHITRMGDSGA